MCREAEGSSSTCSQVAVADADNFMDFSDTTPMPGAPVACISRPQLSADRQTVYEDTSRSGHVLAEMHRLYLTGRLCDVVLCVDSERIPCHRLVMAASSVYFERMFLNDMTESRSPEVILLSFPSRVCVPPSRTSAEACFNAGLLRTPRGGTCSVARLPSLSLMGRVCVALPSTSLDQARRIG